MKNVLEFLVDRIDANSLVCGISCSSDDIPVGAVFVSAELRSSDETVRKCVPVSLKLSGVSWYRRSIGFIPGGHSASLVMSGHGLAAVSSLLADAESGQYVFLRAQAQQVLQADAAVPRGLI